MLVHAREPDMLTIGYAFSETHARYFHSSFVIRLRCIPAHRPSSKNMCRSIKQLRFADAEPTEQELYEAALQFVRKVSGYRKPSQRNEQAFELAVTEIAAATRKMLDNLVVLPAPVRPKNESVEPHTHPHTHPNRHDHAHPRRKSERR